MPLKPLNAGHHLKSGVILRLVSVITVIVILLAGCTFIAPESWHKTDPFSTWHEGFLRLVDPADAPNPGSDIIAISSHQLQDSLLFRVDFLGTPDPSINLQVSLSEFPGQNAGLEVDDFSFSYQPGKEFVVYRQEQSSDIEVSLLETGDDWLIFGIEGPGLLPKPFAKVFTSTDSEILDETSWMDLQKTARPTYLFISFYNTLQTGTPAQTLRSWDGAHTGPNGSRHGLRYLLEAASEYQVPITLLDIKQPAALDALVQLAEIPQIQELVGQNLLFIPDAVYGDPSAHGQMLSLSRQSGLQYGLSVSNAVFGPVAKTFPGYRMYFYASGTVSAPIYSNASYRLVPVPVDSHNVLLDNQGFTIPALQALANAGADPEAALISAFGGDFQDSLWGDPIVAAKAMEYISSHPWIHPLTYIDLNQLSAIPVSDFNNSCANLLCTPKNSLELLGDEYSAWLKSIYPQLVRLQSNPVTYSAWQLYARITDLTLDSDLALLQWKYRSTLEKLILAAGWADQPYELQACYDSPPPDYCILANDNYLAVVSPETTGLVMLFTRQNNQVSQFVAPYSQFIVGLSDPSTWEMASANPDPALVESGFALDEAMTKSTLPNKISFSSLDGLREITYTLNKDSLEVSITSQDTVSYSLPVIGILAGSGNGYSLNKYHTIHENPQPQLLVEISGALSVDSISAFDSADLLSLPEDPNLAYPQGHYLPYPFSMVNIMADQNIFIKFSGNVYP